MPDITKLNNFVKELNLKLPEHKILLEKINDPAIQGESFSTHRKFLETKRVDLRATCFYLLRNLSDELKDMRDEHVATWTERMRVPLWYRNAQGVLNAGRNDIP
jgi:hypothetical protein